MDRALFLVGVRRSKGTFAIPFLPSLFLLPQANSLLTTGGPDGDLVFYKSDTLGSNVNHRYNIENMKGVCL